jgi:hypothetical protein
MKKQNIYICGVFFLGVAHPSIKDFVGGGIFAAMMLLLALLIAWIANKYGR